MVQVFTLFSVWFKFKWFASTHKFIQFSTFFLAFEIFYFVYHCTQLFFYLIHIFSTFFFFAYIFEQAFYLLLDICIELNKNGKINSAKLLLLKSKQTVFCWMAFLVIGKQFSRWNEDCISYSYIQCINTAIFIEERWLYLWLQGYQMFMFCKQSFCKQKSFKTSE